MDYLKNQISTLIKKADLHLEAVIYRHNLHHERDVDFTCEREEYYVCQIVLDRQERIQAYINELHIMLDYIDFSAFKAPQDHLIPISLKNYKQIRKIIMSFLMLQHENQFKVMEDVDNGYIFGVNE